MIELAHNLWIVERPQRFYGLEVGTRMTVIRLADGSVLLHSPVELDAEVRWELDAIGRVRYVVAPNRVHHLYAGDVAFSPGTSTASSSPTARSSSTAGARRYDAATRGCFGEGAMTESWPQQLEAWHDFYVIVGGAAAGLTGLMFIVVSLGPPGIVYRASRGVRAFVTPTVVFFASVLVVAAVMATPTLGPATVAVALAVGSIGMLVYLWSVEGHKQWRENNLDRLDWLWYIALPIVSYVATLAAAGAIFMRVAIGLELLGGAMLFLLVIAIHNAWDLVLWMTQQPRGGGTREA